MSNNLINQIKILQIIGRCRRLENCASYVSNSLKKFMECKNLLAMTNKERTNTNVAYMHYKFEIIGNKYINHDYPKFLSIYHYDSDGLNKSISRLSRFINSDLQRDKWLFEAMLQHHIDVKVMSLISSIQGYMFDTIQRGGNTDSNNWAMIMFISSFVVDLLSLDEITS
jgi:hypothetical protein